MLLYGSKSDKSTQVKTTNSKLDQYSCK